MLRILKWSSLVLTIAVLAGCGPSKPTMSLHDAAEKGNVKQIKAHLHWGCDVNERQEVTFMGQSVDEIMPMAKMFGMDTVTPLELAVMNKHGDVAELLLKNGADVGKSLFFAVRNDDGNVVKLLLKHGADVNDGANSAVDQNKPDMLELLLDKGANPSAVVTLRGDTLLHGAAFDGYVDVMKILLKHDADVKIRNKDEKTPLDMAMDRDQQEAVKLLVKYGAAKLSKKEAKELQAEQAALRQRIEETVKNLNRLYRDPNIDTGSERSYWREHLYPDVKKDKRITELLRFNGYDTSDLKMSIAAPGDRRWANYQKQTSEAEIRRLKTEKEDSK